MSQPNPELFYSAVRDFLGGVSTLDDLRDRTIPAVYLYDDTHDRPAQTLVYYLIGRFADDDDGLWTEEEFREDLRAWVIREWPELHGKLVVDSAQASGATPTPRLRLKYGFTEPLLLRALFPSGAEAQISVAA